AFSISPAVNGSLGWDNDTMTFTPDADLAYSATYDVTLGTGAEDLAGNALAADFVWNFTTVAEADTTAPVITAVANDTPTTDSVTITWTTDENSNNLVKYGTVSGTYPDNESNATMVTSHSIALTGLTPETTYYFVVNSTDASDNPAESAEYNFTTAAAQDTTQPAIHSATLSQNAIISNGADSTILTVHAYSGNIDMDIASVTVNLSAIGGPDEHELDGTQNMGTGTWSTTFNTTFVGTFDLTVNVTNDAGNSDTKDVTLAAAPYKYTLELKQGWNMISLPYNVTAVGIDTTQKLGDMITAAGVPCYSVAWFNATLQTMESDLINLPDDMPQDTPGLIVGGQAYFVFVADNKDVAVFGTLW
ncbi:MAG: Ig-like domain-containing protein, partial [Methanosarcinales archaeon]|nr:Ig-like domain-containing protein [Methanosarcinales archaeon]